MADGSGMHITHVGNYIIPTPSHDIHLKQVLHVPHTSKNLVSIHQLTYDNNVSVEFHLFSFLTKDCAMRKIILRGKCRGGLYPLPSLEHSSSRCVLSVTKPLVSRWHGRLGHPSYAMVHKVLVSNNLSFSRESNNGVCNACQQSNGHQLPFPKFVSVSIAPLELVFLDVWCPTPSSVGTKSYYVSFINEYSKFTWIYLLKHKSEVFEKFHLFQQHVERLLNGKIVVVQTDWDGQYQRLNLFFSRIGISHLVSCPHTHQQNGAAEQKHRHVVEVGLSLLSHVSMPQKFWDEAYLAIVFLINRLPSHVINMETHMERLFHRKPDYSFIKTFGCACWPNLHPYNTHKLSFQSIRCVFLGYSQQHKGYKCLEPSSGRVYISHGVVFDEIVFPFFELHPNAGTQLCSEILLLHPMLLNPCGGLGVGVANMHDVANPNPVVVAPVEENIAGALGEEIAQNDVGGATEEAMDHLGAAYPGADPRDASMLPSTGEIGFDPGVAAALTASTLT
jgi:hypothetical protein